MSGKRLVRNPDVVFRVVGEETILVPVRSSVVDLRCLFMLNETGAFVWQQLDEPSTMDEIQHAMVQEFDVEDDQAQQDLRHFIAQLLQEKCIFELEEDLSPS